jgi:hypothetical protein
LIPVSPPLKYGIVVPVPSKLVELRVYVEDPSKVLAFLDSHGMETTGIFIQV